MEPTRCKCLTVKINADTSGFSAAMAASLNDAKKLNKELRKTAKLLKKFQS